MQSQNFLEKHEQDTCEYCHGLREISLFDVHDPKKELITLFGMIDKNNLIIERMSGTSGVCKINYCPMCGRRLSDD